MALDDAGNYTCRVDFVQSQTMMALLQLTVHGESVLTKPLFICVLMKVCMYICSLCIEYVAYISMYVCLLVCCV